jgi:hypothetical protein
MSSSSDGVADEPWFEAWVPRYISSGETFCVIVDDERGRFSMRIPCPIGASGGSKIMLRHSDGHTRVWCSDNETSTSGSVSSSSSEVSESFLDKSVPETCEEVTYDSIQQSAYNTYDESLYDSLPPITEVDVGASNAAEGRDKLVVKIAAGIPCGIDTNDLSKLKLLRQIQLLWEEELVGS